MISINTFNVRFPGSSELWFTLILDWLWALCAITKQRLFINHSLELYTCDLSRSFGCESTQSTLRFSYRMCVTRAKCYWIVLFIYYLISFCIHFDLISGNTTNGKLVLFSSKSVFFFVDKRVKFNSHDFVDL